MRTRFKTLDEFYKALENLVDRLMISNGAEDATKLDNLMHHSAWTTGSELLGELQLALKDMKGKYPKDLAEEINECYIFTVYHRKILGLH